MKLYSLYDAYETETGPGELICTSDYYAEIKAAAKERYAETDGECSLFVMTRIPLERRDNNAKAEDHHKA